MVIKVLDYGEQGIDPKEWEKFCDEVAEEFPRWQPNYSSVEYWESWKKEKE